MPTVQLARFNFTFHERNDTIGEWAEVAQLVEQLIRNQQVVGSSPTFGSMSSILRLNDSSLFHSFDQNSSIESSNR